MELLAALVAALAVFVTVNVFSAQATTARMDSRLGRLYRSTLSYREAELSTPFYERVTMPTIAWLRRVFSRTLPQSMAATFERRLVTAGEPMTVRTFVIWQVVMAVVALFLLYTGSGGMRGLMLGALVLGVLITGTLPQLWLRSAVKKRLDTIQKALPDAVDLIVTTVEAGQSVDSALWEVATESKGPLSDELLVVMREVALGRSRRESLLRMIERAPVPELKTFVQALLQAQKTGIPLGQVLRTQSKEIRRKKRQRAEEAAGRAPVKMVLVLVFLVMPAMIIVMLGPAMLRIGTIT